MKYKLIKEFLFALPEVKHVFEIDKNKLFRFYCNQKCWIYRKSLCNEEDFDLYKSCGVLIPTFIFESLGKLKEKIIGISIYGDVYVCIRDYNEFGIFVSSGDVIENSKNLKNVKEKHEWDE